MREIIIDTYSHYQFSKGRPYPIIIYEYFGDGKVEKLHEGYIDSCVEFLCELDNIGIILTDCNNRFSANFEYYLKQRGIETVPCHRAYNYIRESGFRKRFISYWIETKP